MSDDTKIPPHSIEAEEAVIASLLVDVDDTVVKSVAPILKGPDFFREKNAWVYNVCLTLWERGEARNEVTVAYELGLRDQLEVLGGMAYLSRLVTELPTPIGADYYAKIVKRTAVAREIIIEAGRIRGKAYSDNGSLPDALEDWRAAGERLRESAAPILGLSGASGLTLTRLADFLSEPEETVPWVVENMLRAGGLSLIGGKPKIGKSTLARNMALAKARGARFLGRSTAPPEPVIYVCLEDARHQVREHFERMGGSDEVILIHVGHIPPENALASLGEAIRREGATLAIADPLLKFVRVKDVNNYAETSAALEPLLALARDTGCHISCTHHMIKVDLGDAGDAILGSTALFGSVDAGILLKRREGGRTASSIQRDGVDLEATVLTFDKDAGLIGVGGQVAEVELAEAKAKVLETLRLAGEDLTEDGLRDRAGVATALCVKAVRALVAERVVDRHGRGRKGDPYTYFVADASRYLIPANEQNEQNEENEENEENDNEGSRNSLSRFPFYKGKNEKKENFPSPDAGPETPSCPTCGGQRWYFRPDGSGPVCGRCHPSPLGPAEPTAADAGVDPDVDGDALADETEV